MKSRYEFFGFCFSYRKPHSFSHFLLHLLGDKICQPSSISFVPGCRVATWPCHRTPLLLSSMALGLFVLHLVGAVSKAFAGFWLMGRAWLVKETGERRFFFFFFNLCFTWAYYILKSQSIPNLVSTQ